MIDRHKNTFCKECSKLIYSTSRSGMCVDCYNKTRKEAKIEKWLKTGDTNCKVSSTIRGCIREYILDRQENKCSICGIINEWNGKRLNFVLDHIDGDASNNMQDNLRLICPNCDSQLPTFKSRNKNSARSHRRLTN